MSLSASVEAFITPGWNRGVPCAMIYIASVTTVPRRPDDSYYMSGLKHAATDEISSTIPFPSFDLGSSAL